ncbi:HNH endonuclease [Corynebacterium sp. YIM 101645]|uniref:HNH endonuclease n=1 Tax=Corynebacterium lemuris TaxID=1859292 RepID=A0ABT2FU32_9CORY|nr:HNH endonuclease [Corynebacterium lemuris]MCS5478726.1 HNH endonuclease [Corynebacterium lemuris]
MTADAYCCCFPRRRPAEVCLAYHGTTPETWKWIPGWEGYYFASDKGRVLSAYRQDGRGLNMGRVLITSTDVKGYPLVTLYRYGVPHTRRVHVLVLETFTGPRPEGMEARHLNGNKTDNRVDNLAWGTRSENTLDAVRHRTHPSAAKTHCKRGHLLDGANLKPSGLLRGHRVCLACERARKYVGRHPQLDLQTVADDYYRQVMGEGDPIG